MAYYEPPRLIGTGTDIARYNPGGPLAPGLARGRAPTIIREKHSTVAAQFAYEHPDLDDDPQEDKHLPYDLMLAKAIAQLKEREYPGHPFEVHVETEQGVVLVSIPALMGPINRYIIHVRDLYSDPKLDLVKRAFGEILERYKISRAGYSRDDFASAVSADPIVFRRHKAVPD